MVALSVVVGAAHSLVDAVTATVGVASRRRHQRLVAVEQLVTRQAVLLRLRLHLSIPLLSINRKIETNQCIKTEIVVLHKSPKTKNDNKV